MNIEEITKRITVDENGCWIWIRSTNSAGYGQFTKDKKYWLAHRYSYSCFHELSDNDVIRHMCHNTKCANPFHLEKGTHKDNYRDSVDVHKNADMKRRSEWKIGSMVYDTCRQAQIETGISMGLS